MGEFNLYFVAFFKHGAPQHLEAGPFMDYCDALDDVHRRDVPSRFCIVKTSLLFQMCDH